MSNPSAPRMVALRAKMDVFDLHFNHSYNGVFLPTSSQDKLLANAVSPAHSKIHTNIYKQNVYDRLINSKNADEFVDGLENIRQLILNGEFNY